MVLKSEENNIPISKVIFYHFYVLGTDGGIMIYDNDELTLTIHQCLLACSGVTDGDGGGIFARLKSFNITDSCAYALEVLDYYPYEHGFGCVFAVELVQEGFASIHRTSFYKCAPDGDERHFTGMNHRQSRSFTFNSTDDSNESTVLFQNNNQSQNCLIADYQGGYIEHITSAEFKYNNYFNLSLNTTNGAGCIGFFFIDHLEFSYANLDDVSMAPSYIGHFTFAIKYGYYNDTVQFSHVNIIHTFAYYLITNCQRKIEFTECYFADCDIVGSIFLEYGDSAGGAPIQGENIRDISNSSRDFESFDTGAIITCDYHYKSLILNFPLNSVTAFSTPFDLIPDPDGEATSWLWLIILLIVLFVVILAVVGVIVYFKCCRNKKKADDDPIKDNLYTDYDESKGDEVDAQEPERPVQPPIDDQEEYVSGSN